MVKLLFFHFWVTKKLEKYQTTLKLLIRKWKNKILISNHSRQLYWMKYHIIWNDLKIQVCCFLWLQIQICHSIGVVYDHEITEYMYLPTLTIVIYLSKKKKKCNVTLTTYTYTPWWTRFKWAWLCAIKVAHSFHLVTFFTSISDDGVQAIFIIVFASNTTLQRNVFMVSYIRGFVTDS